MVDTYSGMATASDDRPFSVDIDVRDGRTVIEVTGERNAAVVVRSASGERVYLPLEEASAPDAGSPYSPVGGGGGASENPPNPYDGPPSDSPYNPDPGTATEDVTPTKNGFRIVYPEPATDVRFIR